MGRLVSGTMNASEIFTPAQGLDVHETEDGLIVFNPVTDRVHHLNHTAGAVFSLCDGARDGNQLAQAIASLFSLDAPPTQEVQTTLAELVGEGVLVARPSDGT